MDHRSFWFQTGTVNKCLISNLLKEMSYSWLKNFMVTFRDFLQCHDSVSAVPFLLSQCHFSSGPRASVLVLPFSFMSSQFLHCNWSKYSLPHFFICRIYSFISNFVNLFWKLHCCAKFDSSCHSFWLVIVGWADCVQGPCPVFQNMEKFMYMYVYFTSNGIVKKS